MKIGEIVELSKCFSTESRVKLIKLLGESELCVCELEAVTGQTQSAISQHLRILYNVGLVNKRRDGQWIYYSLNQAKYTEMLEGLQQLVASPLAEMAEFSEELSRYQCLGENEGVRKCKGMC